MRNFATALVTMAFLGWGAPAAAQSFGFGAHAGVSIPTGSYSDAADLGFSGGLDFVVPLTMVSPALHWYTSADAVGHSAASPNIDGGFLTIPVLTGLRADVGTLGMIRPFATGQLGLGFIRAPDVGQASRSTTEFGFALGGGLQLTQNVYAGAKWFNFPSVDFDAGGNGESMSFFDIYLGFGVR
jgi:opacity protein-like surface antigen